MSRDVARGVNLPSGSRHRLSNQTDYDEEVLTLVAPAGLRKTGTLLTDITQPINPADANEKKRLVEIAPAYGVELHLKG